MGKLEDSKCEFEKLLALNSLSMNLFVACNV